MSEIQRSTIVFGIRINMGFEAFGEDQSLYQSRMPVVPVLEWFRSSGAC